MGNLLNGVGERFTKGEIERYANQTQVLKTTKENVKNVFDPKQGATKIVNNVNFGNANKTGKVLKKKGIMKTIGDFFKSKIGKKLIVGLLLGGLASIIMDLYNKYKEKSSQQAAPPNVEPVKEQEKEAHDSKQITPGTIKPGQKEYVVVKNDNVWNIAKKDLIANNKDKANYKPSNSDIAKRTKELMELNGLHYESDNYRVIIQPNQELKLR